MFNRDPSLGRSLTRSLTSRIKYKDPKTGVLAIQLLEALIKNCPHFHRYVADEDFMHTLVKTAKGKYATSKGFFGGQKTSTYEENKRIEKMLLLIQSLGKSFANSQSYPIFKRTYSQLKREGLRFPEPLKDEGAPIFSPPAKKPEAVERDDLKTNDNLVSPDMKLAQENAVLLYTMLDSSPEGTDLRKEELITTLIGTLRAKQTHIMKVLSNVQSGIHQAPEVVSDAFSVNDVLNQTIAYYDGLISGKLARKKPESKKKKKDKADKEKDSKTKRSGKSSRKKKVESDSEDSVYSSESEEEDMLGFSSSSKKTKKSPKTKSKRKGVKDKKDKHKEVPAVAPPPRRLAPPSSGGKRSTRRKGSDGSSPNRSPKNQPSDDADDLLHFADLTISNGAHKKSDDFFSFDESPPKAKGKKKSEPEPASSGGDDFEDDEFFAIANRHAEPVAAPVQKAPAQAVAANPFDDDAFFAEIGTARSANTAGSSTTNGHTSHASTATAQANTSSGNFLDEFDPLS